MLVKNYDITYIPGTPSYLGRPYSRTCPPPPPPVPLPPPGGGSGGGAPPPIFIIVCGYDNNLGSPTYGQYVCRTVPHYP